MPLGPNVGYPNGGSVSTWWERRSPKKENWTLKDLKVSQVSNYGGWIAQLVKCKSGTLEIRGRSELHPV